MCYVQDVHERGTYYQKRMFHVLLLTCVHHELDMREDYDKQVQYQADRFMSLLVYLFHRPEDRKPKS